MFARPALRLLARQTPALAARAPVRTFASSPSSHGSPAPPAPAPGARL